MDVYGVSGADTIDEEVSDVLYASGREEGEVHFIGMMRARARRTRNYYRNPRRSMRLKLPNRRRSARLQATVKK